MRLKVLFKDISTTSSNVFFKCLDTFSRILSNITIVSFNEYPTIVKNAAIIDRLISRFNNENIPRVIIIS